MPSWDGCAPREGSAEGWHGGEQRRKGDDGARRDDENDGLQSAPFYKRSFNGSKSRVSWPACGCVLVVLLLVLITAGIVALAFSSVATPILASLLILGGLGLAAFAWAERG